MRRRGRLLSTAMTVVSVIVVVVSEKARMATQAEILRMEFACSSARHLL